MEQEEFLIENIKEFVKEGKEAKLNKAYNSAVTLFFKALAVSTDLYILREEGFIPKNHTERFEILRSKYKEIYRILNKDFPVYQQSYRLKLDIQYCEVLEKDVEELIKITKIKIED